MNNLCLITSVINPPNNPLSYSNIRSIYTPDERYTQTKNTILSICNKIPNHKIFIIECSILTNEQEQYLKNNCDFFLNVYDNESIRNNIFSNSKSLGEGTMTIEALKYIINKNIKFDNLFKISGRYYLTDNFNYIHFDNQYSIFKKINSDSENIFTGLFKIPYHIIFKLLHFLEENKNLMYQYIGYEILFGIFLKTIDCKINYLDPIGLQGLVTVDGSYYNG